MKRVNREPTERFKSAAHLEVLRFIYDLMYRKDLMIGKRGIPEQLYVEWKTILDQETALCQKRVVSSLTKEIFKLDAERADKVEYFTLHFWVNIRSKDPVKKDAIERMIELTKPYRHLKLWRLDSRTVLVDRFIEQMHRPINAPLIHSLELDELLETIEALNERLKALQIWRTDATSREIWKQLRAVREEADEGCYKMCLFLETGNIHAEYEPTDIDFSGMIDRVNEKIAAVVTVRKQGAVPLPIPEDKVQPNLNDE